MMSFFKNKLQWIALFCGLVIIAGIIFYQTNSQAAATPRTDLAALIAAKKINPDKIYIHIVKSKYRLEIKADSVVIKSYPCVFGKYPKGDKMQEGDRKTPVGKFKVKARYPHPSWNKFIWINYPTAESWDKFNKRKAKKELDADASIGGDIGIHGVPSGTDYMIDQRINWTLGCISLKNDAIEEIYKNVKVGTVIWIEE